MSVRVERVGAIWTVVLDRPERRNAVDGPTAASLAEAFREFEADPDSRVAVLWGAGGTFCSGADIKAISGDGEPNRLASDGDGPMGPSRMLLDKPWSRPSKATRWRACWSWRSGATSASPPRTRPSGSSADAGVCP